MKINGVNHSNVNPYKNQSLHTERQQGAFSRDQVEISQKAKQLQSESTFSAGRREKIEALKQKVDSGQYQVNAYETAKKFYEFWMNDK